VKHIWEKKGMNNKAKIFCVLMASVSTCFAREHKNKYVSMDSIADHVFCYTNPITMDTAISMRDHCIVKVGEKWYCIGTSNPVWTGPNPGVRMLVSDDMIHWRQHS
jgi:beta-xylosidase